MSASSAPTSYQLLDGKATAAAMRAEVAADVADLIAAGGRQPKLVAVLVGDNPASRAYVGSKARACAEVGIDGETLRLPADVTRDALLAQLARLRDDDAVDGILVQLPLPDHLSERVVLDHVPTEKDVDGFHAINVGRLWLDEPALTPATPTGIVALLRRHDLTLEGQHAVIVGRSAIVGKPMAGLLLRANCTVSICHSRTRDLAAICRQADILIAAVGRPAFLGPEHVREGAVVIDVGINRITDPARVEALFPGDEKRRAALAKRGSTLVGDVDFTRVAPRTRAITPVPGGVGPLTVAQLLVNTVTASRQRQNRLRGQD
ncbi:MAG: bifunctional 5,10-methylenetetrahydrofolate dehydrogenase/5,10-methenyltetrahydrofolate cyclohydrolase [Acidobacteriota bacterium]